MFVFSKIQEKAKLFARGLLGEAEAGNLHSGASASGEGGAPGHGEGKVPDQGEGKAAGGQEDSAPKTGEV